MTLRRGFSLIEVNMAILVVAGGLLTLFALFPAGLRMSTMSLADMRHSMFTAEVFARMQANAASITDPSTWMNPQPFWDAICKGTGTQTLWNEMAKQADPGAQNVKVDLGPRQGSPSPSPQRFSAGGEFPTYFASKSGYVEAPARFKIRLQRLHPSTAPAPDNRINGLNRFLPPSSRDQHLDYLTWRISIVVSDQPDVVFDDNPIYHCELRFRGAP